MFDIKTTISLTEEEKKDLLQDLHNLLRKAYHQSFKITNWSPDVHPVLRTFMLKLANKEDEFCL